MPGRKAVLVASVMVVLAIGPQVLARSGPADADLCFQAAAEAARLTGVPYKVLRAIAVVETGRDGQPWPWTVNIGGEGHWPETEEDAVSLVETALQSGLTNVDLGCFQLNLYWHAGAFLSVEDMLDPQRNATYAAEFLAAKHAETGDWSAAAAAYHSATPEHAEAYLARFEETWVELDEDNPADTPASEMPPNRFPLLVNGRSASPGSLVPATPGGLRLIGGS